MTHSHTKGWRRTDQFIHRQGERPSSVCQVCAQGRAAFTGLWGQHWAALSCAGRQQAAYGDTTAPSAMLNTGYSNKWHSICSDTLPLAPRSAALFERRQHFVVLYAQHCQVLSISSRLLILLEGSKAHNTWKPASEKDLSSLLGPWKLTWVPGQTGGHTERLLPAWGAPP